MSETGRINHLTRRAGRAPAVSASAPELAATGRSDLGEVIHKAADLVDEVLEASRRPRGWMSRLADCFRSAGKALRRSTGMSHPVSGRFASRWA